MGNWDPEQVSTADDTVIFNSVGDFSVTLNTLTRARNLTFGATSDGSIKIIKGNVGLIIGEAATNGNGGTISVLAGDHEIVGLNRDAGDITINGNAAAHLSALARWNIAAGASLTFTDVHLRTNHNGIKIAKEGEGLMVLAGDSVGGSNAWRFDRFDVEAGTLRIAHAKATGYAGNNFRVLAGATLELAAGYNSIDGTLTLNGSGVGGKGALYNLTGNNMIAEGAGTIALASSATVGVAEDTTLTIAQDISGAGGLIKEGGGTLHLAQTTTASAFSGGVAINAGTLRVSHDAALGSGGVGVGVNGTLQIDAGIALGNNLGLAGGQVARSVNAGDAWTLGTTGAVTSDLGGATTSAAIIASQVASGAGVANYAFMGFSAAGNDHERASEVFSLSGTGGDIYVLQLGVDALPAGSLLGWLDAGDQWVNAVEGNSQAGALATTSVAGSFAASGASATADYLGSWGYDADNGVVWAILDHGGQFAVVSSAIPEPGAYALLLGGTLLGWMLGRRRVAR